MAAETVEVPSLASWEPVLAAVHVKICLWARGVVRRRGMKGFVKARGREKGPQADTT